MSGSERQAGFSGADAILLAAMCHQANQQFETGQFTLPEGFAVRHIICALAGVEQPEAEVFGFMAESDTEIVIALRGTDSFKDNESDQDLYQLPYPFIRQAGLTHRGFTCIYQSTRDDLIRQLARLAPAKRLLITGYSLGAAVATLAALDIAVNTAFRRPSVYTYGSPRTGDPHFASRYNQLVRSSFRVFNVHDVIPTIPDRNYFPPFTARGLYYRHVGHKYPVSFQLDSIARNHYINCYFQTLSQSNPSYTRQLCTANPDFCPDTAACTPLPGGCGNSSLAIWPHGALSPGEGLRPARSGE